MKKIFLKLIAAIIMITAAMSLTAFAAGWTLGQGGNCMVVDLPEEGITGNDHFMFQDLNNDVIADHIESWNQENVEQ